jgi:hypothetical protein
MTVKLSIYAINSAKFCFTYFKDPLLAAYWPMVMSSWWMDPYVEDYFAWKKYTCISYILR